MSSAKILIYDVETSPHVALSWGEWGQNIRSEQVVIPSKLICWAAKWVGGREVFSGTADDIHKIWSMLVAADMVVTYNGKSFDEKVLNREFILAKFGPPPRVPHVDLYRVVRGNFRFPHNKMVDILAKLGLGRKAETGGLDLWKGVMAGDGRAMAKMVAYNKRDVQVTEELYLKLRPWVHNHPNVAAATDVTGCPNCGSGNFRKRGTRVTRAKLHQRWSCNDCGAWFSGKV